jgi:maltooligosyltrehalose trehalohydrolase
MEGRPGTYLRHAKEVTAAMSIQRNEVGVHVSGTSVQFGMYLPGVTKADGFDLRVRIIHIADQFVPEIPSVPQSLTFDPAHPLGLWSATVDLTAVAAPSGSHFGQNGQYLYRYDLLRNGAVVTQTFLDPFAVENGPGLLGVFTVGAQPAFSWTDAAYRTPPLDELVIYELNVAEFYGTFAGVITRLDYLDGLGVNCLSLMPITPVKHEFDWGYGPLGYFAPEDFLGGPIGLKQLVDAAHARDIAVVLDVVYGHADDSFAYSLVYDDIKHRTGLQVANPMMQDPNRDGFGRGFDHTLAFARQYCLEANKHWLDEYHVDGFRMLNFSDSDGTLTLPAPRAGTYREMVDRLNRKADFDVVAASAGAWLTLRVHSNYGQIFVTPPPAVGV